ncbi:uncharacterized protein LOC121764249 [Salvia splendens]|uniref:uncharacterized protein LOC121764249 n=1 Tax=Salvia splendens TaxID=180675 RepID=UPI001C257E4A|nr:uncharacterized protein LOC121764249 [Salvia splendens]
MRIDKGTPTDVSKEGDDLTQQKKDTGTTKAEIREAITENDIKIERRSKERDWRVLQGRFQQHGQTSEAIPLLEVRKKKDHLVDFMEIFGKLEINLPFIQALKLPLFSKFIKEFIAGKTKHNGKIVIGESISAVVQKRRMPSKRTNVELSHSIDKEVVGWCEAMNTLELTDEELAEAIVEFCKYLTSATSRGLAHLASVEKLPNPEELTTSEMDKKPLP